MKVIIVGAGGNLGTRLIRRGLVHGLHVTAYVRDPGRLSARLTTAETSQLAIVQGDAFDCGALSNAMIGHDAVVNAAGHVADSSFAELFATVLAAAVRALGTERRIWFTGGIAALTVPHTRRTGASLVGMPRIYRRHETNWRLLEATRANWSFICPGPMVAAADGAPRTDLALSEDVLPYEVGAWAKFAPPLAIPLYMKRRLPQVTVSYEDVAEIIMSNLEPSSPFFRQRVGVALPAGVTAWKENWAAAIRNPG